MSWCHRLDLVMGVGQNIRVAFIDGGLVRGKLLNVDANTLQIEVIATQPRDRTDWEAEHHIDVFFKRLIGSYRFE